MNINLHDFLKISYGCTKPDQFIHNMSYRDLRKNNIMYPYCGLYSTIYYVNIELINMFSAKKYWNYNRKDILNKIYELGDFYEEPLAIDEIPVYDEIDDANFNL